jgi:hypothetical protein
MDYMAHDPKITDTSKQDPLLHIMEAGAAYRRTGDPSQSIYDQEKRGQREFVAAAGARLPATGTVNDDSNCWFDKMSMADYWKSCGVVIGPVVEGDPIWVEATLPDGWKIEGTDHSMWSALVDRKGRHRARIFYKAASYDREAFVQAVHRYSASTERQEERNRDSPSFAIVRDGESEIHRLGPFSDDAEWTSGTGCRTAKSGYMHALEAGKEWLNENKPGWDSITAYWD